jgi:hypothetical protein
MAKIINPCTAKEINIKTQAIFFALIDIIRSLINTLLFDIFQDKTFNDKDIADRI